MACRHRPNIPIVFSSLSDSCFLPSSKCFEEKLSRPAIESPSQEGCVLVSRFVQNAKDSAFTERCDATALSV